ncbi:MAG TPA: large conductance mechanosensitive channel protein MscL [Flavobacteriia bacterium]|nr:large conductance mechanosensitive channel protein MscL [Flavobacteriia bacterium]
MLQEFKKFIMGGNVIEFSVAVIMAGAIGLVVKGFVSLIMMPFVSHFSSGVSFKDWKIVLDEAVKEGDKIVRPENAILYGEWLDAIINLLTVGLVMFLIVKIYNKLKTKEAEAPAAPPAPSKEEVLLTEIRDLLKKQ